MFRISCTLAVCTWSSHLFLEQLQARIFNRRNLGVHRDWRCTCTHTHMCWSGRRSGVCTYDIPWLIGVCAYDILWLIRERIKIVSVACHILVVVSDSGPQRLHMSFQVPRRWSGFLRGAQQRKTRARKGFLLKFERRHYRPLKTARPPTPWLCSRHDPSAFLVFTILNLLTFLTFLASTFRFVTFCKLMG